jgi:hypothetical protein
MTDAASTPAAGDGGLVEIPRRPITPTLLSITLALEGMVVFFAALAAFGLRHLDMATAFIGGAIIMVIFFMTAGLVRRAAWAPWFGWVLQAVLLATGIILLPMLVIGALFVALWIWCWIKGHSIDRANAAAIAAAEANPSGGTA